MTFKDISEYWFKNRDNRDLIQAFHEQFPDKCPICSYHRYGITHGHIEAGTPVAYHANCRESASKGEEPT